MRFKLDLDGSAWLDGLKLKDVLSVDVKNINPCDKMELTIRLSVEEAAGTSGGTAAAPSSGEMPECGRGPGPAPGTAGCLGHDADFGGFCRGAGCGGGRGGSACSGPARRFRRPLCLHHQPLSSAGYGAVEPAGAGRLVC